MGIYWKVFVFLCHILSSIYHFVIGSLMGFWSVWKLEIKICFSHWFWPFAEWQECQNETKVDDKSQNNQVNYKVEMICKWSSWSSFSFGLIDAAVERQLEELQIRPPSTITRTLSNTTTGLPAHHTPHYWTLSNTTHHCPHNHTHHRH